MFFYLIMMIFNLVLMMCMLLLMAYFTYFERKIMSSYQNSMGPVVWGLEGLVQPLLDGIKYMTTEYISTTYTTFMKFIFIICPMYSFMIILLAWSFIPLYWNIYINYNEYSLLIIIMLLELESIGIMLAGFFSGGNKLTLMGSFSLMSQKIAFNMSVSLNLLTIALLAGSFNLHEIIFIQMNTNWFIFSLWPLAILFFIAMLGDSARIPFDLPEAEAELAGGFQLEHGSTGLVFFVITEYASMLLLTILFVILFLGGWSNLGLWNSSSVMFSLFMIALKFGLVSVSIMLIRAALPRFRVDQILSIAWKIHLMLSLLLFMYTMMIYSF